MCESINNFQRLVGAEKTEVIKRRPLLLNGAAKDSGMLESPTSFTASEITNIASLPRPPEPHAHTLTHSTILYTLLYYSSALRSDGQRHVKIGQQQFILQMSA